MQTIPLLEVKRQLSTQTKIINFARETLYYLPDFPGFNSKFFCQYGQKKSNITLYLYIIIVVSFRLYWGF